MARLGMEKETGYSLLDFRIETRTKGESDASSQEVVLSVGTISCSVVSACRSAGNGNLQQSNRTARCNNPVAADID